MTSYALICTVLQIKEVPIVILGDEVTKVCFRVNTIGYICSQVLNAANFSYFRLKWRSGYESCRRKSREHFTCCLSLLLFFFFKLLSFLLVARPAGLGLSTAHTNHFQIEFICLSIPVTCSKVPPLIFENNCTSQGWWEGWPTKTSCSILALTGCVTNYLCHTRNSNLVPVHKI